MTYDELNLEELFLKHNFLSAGLHNLFSSEERRLRDEGLRERLSTLSLPPPLMVTFTNDNKGLKK